MSYTTVLAVYPGDRVEDMHELKNSWGSAPVVWDAMVKAHTNADYWSGSVLDAMFQESPSWPEHHTVMMYMTADRAYVLREHFHEAAAHIRAFLSEFPSDSKRVNHWPEIADIFDSNPDVPAIGFYMTSVSENPFYGPWNEAIEDRDQFDWTTAFSVYDVATEN